MKVKRPKKAEKTERATRGKKGRKNFILFVGDEGAILCYLDGNSVIRRLYAPSTSAEINPAFDELLKSDPKVPVTVLVDMMDQSYIRQTFPPVSKMSLPKLVKRRLARDFAPADITGSLPLGRDAGGRKDWNFLLISLASSPALNEWLEFAMERANPFGGIYLVPVEGENFVKELSTSVRGKDRSQWQLLVSHHKVGGFRQIITRNDRLAFTRLAQPIGDSTPAVIAGNIEQEVQNTIEYLKRLGYSEDAGLDVFVIVASEIKGQIDESKFKAAHVNLFSPAEAAQILELQRAALPEDHYADVVFSSFFGRSSKRVLLLESSKSRKIRGLQAAGKALRFGAVAACVAMTLYIGYLVATVMPLTSGMSDLTRQRQRAEDQLKTATGNADLTAEELDRITDIVSLYELYADSDTQPLKFLARFAEVARGTVMMTDWKFVSPEGALKRARNEPEAISIEMKVQFVQRDGYLEEFLRTANGFLESVRKQFPTYKVVSSKLPGMLAADETFEATFGQEQSGANNMLSGDPIEVTLTFTPNTDAPTPPPSGALP